MGPRRLLDRLVRGSVRNVGFSDFQRVVEAAKPYQIRQFLTLIEKYHLKPEE